MKKMKIRKIVRGRIVKVTKSSVHIEENASTLLIVPLRAFEPLDQEDLKPSGDVVLEYSFPTILTIRSVDLARTSPRGEGLKLLRVPKFPDEDEVLPL